MDESTRLEVLQAIAECEAKGEFDHHVDPINWEITLPVTADFPYIPKGRLRLKYAFLRIYVHFFRKEQNRKHLRTEFYGRENMKGIRSAIVTCNHVNKFDCLAVQEAARGHRVYVVGAPFNNMKGSFGECMRAGGMLPLGTEPSVLKQFNRAVSHYLKKGNYVAVYPEQAMWWNYEKPRPFKDGAFTLAVKNKVPVIPMFITFRKSGEYDENGIERKYFTVHVMPPIYPDPSLPRREAVEQMKAENFRLCREKYEEVYGRPLVYGGAEPEEN